MKKLSIFILGLLVIASFTFAQSITVTSPNGGEILTRGNNFSISWTSSGVTGNVNLILWKGSSNLGQIAQNKPANGSYSWHVGDALVNPPGITYPDGTDFKVMVKSIDDWTISDENNGNFTITTPGPAASITVTSPNGGEKLNLGDFINITWGYEEITDNIKIILYYNYTYKKGTIASNIPVSDKSYRWRVGYYNEGTANPKSGYQIEIQTMDGIYKDRSHFPFTICPESSALHPDFKIEYLVMNQEHNFQLSALIKNNGKSYIGPIDFKIIGIGKLTGKIIGKTTRIIERLIHKQNISLDVPEKSVELLNLNWPPDVTYINFRVEIDPLKRIEELNEMNNLSRFYKFFREKTTKPDFLIGYIQYNSGHLYTLIKNEGYKFDGGQVEFRVIGMDRFMGGGKFLMDKRVVKSIPPLDTAIGEIINLCDIDWPLGVKNITFAVYIDPDNKIIELKEDNNFKEQVINK